MKSFGVVSTLMALLVVKPITVLAHPGRTDSNGCHHDRQNGGYHCHGTPAPSPYNPPVYQNPFPSPSPYNPPVYQNPFPSPSPYNPPVYQNTFPSPSPYNPPVYRPQILNPFGSSHNWLLVGTARDGEVRMYVDTTRLKRVKNIVWYWQGLELSNPVDNISIGIRYISVDCTKKVHRVRFTTAFDARGQLLEIANPEDKAPLERPTPETLEYLAMMAVCENN